MLVSPLTSCNTAVSCGHCLFALLVCLFYILFDITRLDVHTALKMTRQILYNGTMVYLLVSAFLLTDKSLDFTAANHHADDFIELHTATL